MRKLKSCIVACADEYELEELRDVAIHARHDQSVSNFIIDGGFSFVNVSTQPVTAVSADLLIVEDEWTIASRILREASECDEVESIVIVPSSSALQQLLSGGAVRPAVITLDFLLDGDSDSEKLEQFKKTSELYYRIKEQWPTACVMGISAWVLEADGKPNSDTISLVNAIRKNGDDVYPKSDGLWSFLPNLVRNALSTHNLLTEKADVVQKLDVATKLRNFELSRYMQGVLAGIDDTLLAIAKLINPYFLWRQGVYEKLPPSLRQSFVTSLLFEGEPGSGKSVLCETIAKALGNTTVSLPMELGPEKNPLGWVKDLNGILNTAYSNARNPCVVVIRADDLVFRRTGDMEPGIAAEWERYMRVVRHSLERAARINNNLEKGFKGKILWLFARNTAAEVGQMFEPLRDYLRRFPMQFPKDLEERKKILIMHAANRGWRFEPNALKVAVEALSDYGGRDFVGDPNTGKGFLFYAISEAQEREQRLFADHQDESRISREITTDIVNEWLSGPEHRDISTSRVDLNRGFGALDSSKPVWNNDSPDTVLSTLSELSPKDRAHVEADMFVMDQIEGCLAVNMSLSATGKRVFHATTNPTRAVQTFFETDRPARVLHLMPESYAKERWPRILRMIAGREALHRDQPTKYPEYAKSAA